MTDLRDDEKKFAPKTEIKIAATKVLHVCKKCDRSMLVGQCWDDKKNFETVYYCPYCKTYE